VEQEPELVGAALQPILVVGVFRDADVVHPLANAPGQRGTFVACEVEPARVADEDEQLFEPGVLALVQVSHAFSTKLRITVEISSSGSTKSAVPVATTASGIPLNSAVAGSWTITVP